MNSDPRSELDRCTDSGACPSAMHLSTCPAYGRDECESTEPEIQSTGPQPLDEDTTIETRATNTVQTLCPLPDAAMPMAVVEVVQYLDEQGEQKYAFRFTEGAAGSTLLGLLELAKHQLFKFM